MKWSSISRSSRLDLAESKKSSSSSRTCHGPLRIRPRHLVVMNQLCRRKMGLASAFFLTSSTGNTKISQQWVKPCYFAYKSGSILGLSTCSVIVEIVLGMEEMIVEFKRTRICPARKFFLCLFVFEFVEYHVPSVQALFTLRVLTFPIIIIRSFHFTAAN